MFQNLRLVKYLKQLVRRGLRTRLTNVNCARDLIMTIISCLLTEFGSFT